MASQILHSRQSLPSRPGSIATAMVAVALTAASFTGEAKGPEEALPSQLPPAPTPLEARDTAQPLVLSEASFFARTGNDNQENQEGLPRDARKSPYSAAFEQALDFFDRAEGGSSGTLVRDRRDRGGATCRGITQKLYDQYRRSEGLRCRSVASITDEERSELLHENFWKALRCDEMPERIARFLFDSCANRGRTGGMHGLCDVLKVSRTARVSDAMIERIYASDEEHLLNALARERLEEHSRMKTTRYHGKGWKNRTEALVEELRALSPSRLE